MGVSVTLLLGGCGQLVSDLPEGFYSGAATTGGAVGTQGMPPGFTTVYRFPDAGAFSEVSPQIVPQGPLLFHNGSLYGVTSNEGALGGGSVFRISLSGLTRSVLQTFVGSSYAGDGFNPVGGLALWNGNLYGMTMLGGDAGGEFGTLFKIGPEGGGYARLHAFLGGGNAEGEGPMAGLVAAGGYLYGTTTSGGVPGQGTVFRYGPMTAPSPSVQVVHAFTGPQSQGANPSTALLNLGGTLYGATQNGGVAGLGTLFRIASPESGAPIFSTIHQFTYTGATPIMGDSPSSSLVEAGGWLYGTTLGGGSGTGGTLFKIDPINPATSFTVLRHFVDPNPNSPSSSPDGFAPQGMALGPDGWLYGVTQSGGGAGSGTLYKIHPSGSGFTLLHTFAGGAHGAHPNAPPIFVGNTLYGTTQGEGTWGGTVYGYTLSTSVPPAQ